MKRRGGRPKHLQTRYDCAEHCGRDSLLERLWRRREGGSRGLVWVDQNPRNMGGDFEEGCCRVEGKEKGNLQKGKGEKLLAVGERGVKKRGLTWGSIKNNSEWGVGRDTRKRENAGGGEKTLWETYTDRGCGTEKRAGGRGGGGEIGKGL